MVLLRCSDYALFSILLLPSHLFHSGKFQVETSVLKFYAPFWMTVFFFFIYFIFQVCLFPPYHPQMFCPPSSNFFSHFNNCASPRKRVGRYFPLWIALHSSHQEFYLYSLPIFNGHKPKSMWSCRGKVGEEGRL